MRKFIALWLSTSILLFACGISDIPFLSPTATPIPTDTPIPSPTLTATLGTPDTPTSTPTLIGSEVTFTPFASFTPIGILVQSATPTATPVGSPTMNPILVGTGFDSINLSTNVVHWDTCDPQTVTFTAQMTDPTKVVDVVLFTRFERKSNGDLTKWNSGISLKNQGNGTFSYGLAGNKMGIFFDAWVQYQLVATDNTGKDVARSPVFPDSLSLSPCP